MSTNQAENKESGENDENWSVTSLLMKAYTLVDQKDFAQAQEILERVLKREPENELVLKYQKVLEAAQAAAEEESSEEEGESSSSSESETQSSSAEASSPAASPKRAGK
jgi:outer membrane protein assembly factor BamD (BamD/ComL family)